MPSVENAQTFPQLFTLAAEAYGERPAIEDAGDPISYQRLDQLRRQAAKLTNIGINSGSDLLTVKARQLKERAARIEAAATPLHKDRSGDIRLGNSGTHARVLLAIEGLTVATPDGRAL